MEGILYKIEQALDNLSSVNRKIGVYLIKNSRKAIWLSAKELADAAGVSQAAVTRFCSLMDVPNYNQLKILISQDLSLHGENYFKDFGSGDMKENIANNLAEQLISSIRDTCSIISEDKIMQAAKLIYEAKMIMCAGIGASYLVAEDLTHKLLRLQKSVFSHYDVDLRKVALTQYTEKDLLIAVSYSGKKQEMLDLAAAAKKQGVPIIAFTRVGNTPLAKLANITLEMASFEHEYRISALSSRIANLYLVDVLFYTFGLHFQEESMEKVRETYDIINE